MRITGNFNIPKVNFKAMHISEEASPIVSQYMEKSDTFERSYTNLRAMSDRNEEDIYIQTTIKGQGLNFQLLDPYTRETKCYLSADKDPEKAAEKAVKKYDEYLTAPKPQRRTLPKREVQTQNQRTQRPILGRRRFINAIFNTK